MNFAEKLFGLIVDGFNKIIDLIAMLMQFLAKILGYLLEFLIGIFYFIMKLFEVAIEVIKIFVACFQFVFALAAGIFRTIKLWITPQISGSVSFPSISNKGFSVVMDAVAGTGLLTIVPMVALAFLWFYFALKMIGLFGGQIMIRYKDGD